jgi:uncharacterized membrane protein
MRAALARMQTQYLIGVEDAVVARDAGRGALHPVHESPAAGALRGAWGRSSGCCSPLSGRRWEPTWERFSGKLADIGINDQFMKDLGATLTPGTSALFVLVRKSTPDKVLEGLKAFAGKGRVLQTSLTKDKEEELRKFIEAK